MGDAGGHGSDAGTEPNENRAPKSSILGQTPFKLDLRIAPRGAPGRAEGRLKPVDRDLLPEPHAKAPATFVFELPTSHTAPPVTATAAPAPASPARTLTLEASPQGTKPADAAAADAAGAAPSPAPQSATGPAPGARTFNVSAQQLTLAPIAPRIDGTAPRPLDFNAVLGKPAVALRHKRNPLGALFKLVLVGGLVAGGFVAVKKFVLTPKWQDDVKVLADQVAARRGLDWDDAVRVEQLEPADYALRLVSSALGVNATDAGALGSEWRAMGVAEGAVDLAEIGHAALADQPAFYDPASGTVYEVAGLSPELRGIALSRALTSALLDQNFDWSDALDGAGPGKRLGIRALHDGDATAIQARTTLETLIGRTQVDAASEQIRQLRAPTADSTSSVTPYAIAVTGPAASASVYLFPDGSSALDRNRTAQSLVTSDAAVFDAVRGLDSVPADLGIDGARSVGMMYWYYALAGRIGSDAAWSAALVWNGDATVVERSLTSYCVTSTIAATSPDGRGVLLDALTQWAEAAPPAAQTHVSPVGDDRIEVTSCDPGVDADTITVDAIRPFGNAAMELASAAALVGAGIPATDEARACVVTQVRSGLALALEDAGSVDPSLIHPGVDLRTPAAQMVLESCRR